MIYTGGLYMPLHDSYFLVGAIQLRIQSSSSLLREAEKKPRLVLLMIVLPSSTSSGLNSLAGFNEYIFSKLGLSLSLSRLTG
jgi:hypothetical protein